MFRIHQLSYTIAQINQSITDHTTAVCSPESEA